MNKHQAAHLLNDRSDRRLYAPLEEARAEVMKTLEEARKNNEAGILALDRLYARRPDIRRTWVGR